MKTFHKWLENIESRRSGIRDVIINFLKDELNITDDETILQMKTTDISPEVMGKLMERGIVSSSDPNIINMVKNGITIRELVDTLAGEDNM